MKIETISLDADGRCEALMGYRVLYDYVHGKHLYIDDLVVNETSRSQGYGASMLEFAEKESKRLGRSDSKGCRSPLNLLTLSLLRISQTRSGTK